MKKVLLFLVTSMMAMGAMAQIQVNSSGDLLTNSHEIYVYNTSSNKCGLGYGAYGATNMVVFSDDNIDFRKRSNSSIVAKVNCGTTPSFDCYANFSFNKLFWTGGICSKIDKFDNFDMPNLYPGSHWYGMLGNSTYRYAAAYIDHAYINAYTTYPSDESVKENVKTIENGLFRVMQLRPVSYDIKESFYDSIPDKDARQYAREHGGMNRIGFISQEVREVMPELISEEPQSKLLGINTIDMIPYLVQAIKEQQKEIEDLRTELLNYEKSYELKSETNRVNADESNAKKVSLSQNMPNPFTTDTKIDMFIPETVSEAILYIYDLQGKQVKSIVVAGRGNTSETIFGNELEAGLYIYSLVTDGKLVGSKQMILTE